MFSNSESRWNYYSIVISLFSEYFQNCSIRCYPIDQLCSPGYEGRLCSKCSCDSDTDCYYDEGEFHCGHCKMNDYSYRYTVLSIFVLICLQYVFISRWVNLVLFFVILIREAITKKKKLAMIAIALVTLSVLVYLDTKGNQDWWSFIILEKIIILEGIFRFSSILFFPQLFICGELNLPKLRS